MSGARAVEPTGTREGKAGKRSRVEKKIQRPRQRKALKPYPGILRFESLDGLFLSAPLCLVDNGNALDAVYIRDWGKRAAETLLLGKARRLTTTFVCARRSRQASSKLRGS